MLAITVKTLDSQNHSFTCEDDITVRGFKDHIAETVAVPAESQRLIYCGRVLQDDKKLNDYDVDGKVIHLVQRAPPQPESRNSNNGAQRQNNNHAMGQGSSQFRYRGHFPRNAMYLGAMSVPTEVVEGQGMPPPRLSNTLSNSRLEAAKRMLQKASQLMDRLDDPSVPLHPSPTENNASETNTQPQASAPQEEERESQSNNGNGGETRDRLGRTVSEIAASFAAAHLASLRNRDNGEAQSDESQPPQSDDAEPRSEQERLDTDRAEAGQSETSDSRPEASTSNNENQNGSRRSTTQVPRPPQMAQLLETLVSAQDRLRPYIDRYRGLMSADPVLSSSSGPDSVADNQRIVDGVSESLHYLSHACHALSDIIVDMGQQPPRNLRCRPIIIQHSAILQAGIPIQIEPHISITGRTMVNQNNTSDEGNEATRPSSPTPTTDQANRSSSSTNQQASQNSNDQQSQSPLLGTILNLPSNLELSMEFRPQSPMDVSSPSAPDGSESEQGQTNNNNNNNNGNGGGNGNSSFLMSSSSPFAIIRDALQSVLNDRQIPMETSSGTSVNTQTNVPYVTIVGQQMDIIMTNSGQSTQARSNIGTHPTTSTQTRSTARPHVLHPHTHMNMGMGMSQNMDFDPFLPCNSHHIRRSPAASATSTSTSQSSQTNQASASEGQSRTHTSSFTASSSARPQVETETFTIGDLNAAHDILENDGQALATGIGLAMTLGELFQGSVNDSVHISFVGSGSGSGSGPSPGEIYLSQNSDLLLADLLRLLNIRMGDFSGGSFLFNLWLFLIRNLTFGGMIQLSRGQPGPLINLRRPLREFLEQSFPESSSIQEDLVEQLVLIDRPYLQNLEPEGEAIDRRIDLPATIETLMRKFSTELVKCLFNNDLDDASFAQEVVTLTKKLDTQSTAVLQHVFQGQQSSLEATALRFLNQFMEGVPQLYQQTVIAMLTPRIRSYATHTTEMSQEEIKSLIVYKDEPPVVPVESVASTSSAPPPVAVASTSKSEDTPSFMQEGEESATVELLPEIRALPEMQDIDVKYDINNIEPVEKFVDETMDLAYGEEIPETFDGAEEFPPEWVAVMARDQVRQRKQAQIQAENGGPIPFSDAYLSILPSKRRKLIEQQKPQILAQPQQGTDTTVVQASVERLVREGICQSNLQEVEGAAQAVAAAPGVRTAFGNAIRDSIHPGRLRTPDFPNARRFPNATKYFTNGEQKDKEGSKKSTKSATAAATTPPTSTNGSGTNK